MITLSGHKSDNMPDEDIILAYKKNQDPELLGMLFERYMLLVYGVSLKYLKNREDSKDAVIQIFEILSRDIPRFEISNFKGWLYKVTRNHCLMILRKRKSPIVQYEENQFDFMESDGYLHPLDDPGNDGILERLPECMGQLSENQRICVEWFYYRQKCYKEIALELKLEERKVKSYIQNGKRNLKICLDKKEILRNV